MYGGSDRGWEFMGFLFIVGGITTFVGFIAIVCWLVMRIANG